MVNVGKYTIHGWYGDGDVAANVLFLEDGIPLDLSSYSRITPMAVSHENSSAICKGVPRCPILRGLMITMVINHVS